MQFLIDKHTAEPEGNTQPDDPGCLYEVQSSGSNQDFGTTKAAKMYFSLSGPGSNAFAGDPVNPPEVFQLIGKVP